MITPAKLAQRATKERLLALKLFLLMSLCMLGHFISTEAFGIETSRRLCNLPYVLYQSALIIMIALTNLINERVFMLDHENMVDNAINYNQI